MEKKFWRKNEPSYALGVSDMSDFQTIHLSPDGGICGGGFASGVTKALVALRAPLPEFRFITIKELLIQFPPTHNFHFDLDV